MRDDATVDEEPVVSEADSSLDGTVWKGPGAQKNHDMTAEETQSIRARCAQYRSEDGV